MCTNDDEYEGYFIPKGTIVVGNTWYIKESYRRSNLMDSNRSILHDPNIYEEPSRFMPERFLKDGKLNPEAPDPSSAAFGFGRRICPGMYMSDSSIFLTIASLLSVFDIRAPVDEFGVPVKLNPEYTNGNLQWVPALLVSIVD